MAAWGELPPAIRAAVLALIDPAGLLERPSTPGNTSTAVRPDPERVVREVVEKRRSRAHGPLDGLFDDGKGLPPFDKHMEDTWRELEALASAADDGTTAPSEAKKP